MPSVTKAERLQRFYDELRVAPAARSLDEAVHLIGEALLSVEDRFSGIPRGDGSTIDGRMYPAKLDNRHVVPGRPDMVRLRSRRHNTYVASGGAILVVDLFDNVEFSKAGADGKVIEL